MEEKCKKYYPCFTCHDRFGRDYTEECDVYCDYAMAIKKLKEYEECEICAYTTCLSEEETEYLKSLGKIEYIE